MAAIGCALEQMPRASSPADPLQALVLLPYPLGRVPGQRYRIEQWLRRFEPLGVQVETVALLTDGELDVLHMAGRWLSKSLAMLRSARRAERTIRGCRANRSVVFVHRTLLLGGPPVLERRLARTGAPIVYDFDDALWVTKTTEANRVVARLKWSGKTQTLCRLARRVVVGTELLAQQVRPWNQQVTVIPPTVETASFPRHQHDERRPVVIGWSGSPTTVEYLSVVAEPLRRLAAHIDVEVRLMGADFPIPGVRTRFRPWRAEHEAAEIGGYDIGLMPLVDDPWTRGKGAMKALLYMAAGVPVVASPVGATPNVVEHGRQGLLATSEDDWVRHLSTLAADPGLRSSLGAAGRVEVERWYSPEVQAPRLAAVLRATVAP